MTHPLFRKTKFNNRERKEWELVRAAHKLSKCPVCNNKDYKNYGLKILCSRCGHMLLRWRDLDHPEKKKVVVEVKEKKEEKEVHGVKKLWRWLNSS